MLKIPQKEKGFVAFLFTILVLASVLGITVSISLGALRGSSMSRNVVRSAQAYYAAEAGLEDALWRVKNFLPYSY